MICISIGNIALIEQLDRIAPPLVELRYDLLKLQPSDLKGKINANIKQIATCRPGYYTEEQNFEILKQAIENGANYIDVEIEASSKFKVELFDLAHKYNCQIIVSYHNFIETPSSEELMKTLNSCYELGGDIAKIACLSKSEKDNARLLALYALEGKKVVLGMGESGKFSRLAALQLGAEFSYVSISEQEITAPGQWTYDQFNSLLNQMNNR